MNACRSWAPLLGLVGGLSLTGCTEFWRWGGDRPAPSTRGAEPSVRSARGEENVAQYTVKRGDTLYSIATQHHLDYHQLASWNSIGPDYRIEVGQVLRLAALGAAHSVVLNRPRKEAATVAREPTTVASGASAVPAVNLERYYQWQWPLRGAIAKTYSLEGGSKGLDIVGAPGQTVIAAAPGRVVYSGSGLKGYGELVIIKHDETYLSAYGYNRRRLVEEGDLVTAGQAIAELGLGPQQKPLLHFEIREHGKALDPLALLPQAQK